jgi:transcriptional regulator GlxA family with amidase domain
MSLDARMRHALELLRCKHMPVSRVAVAVGYSHQTSFASAFNKQFATDLRTGNPNDQSRLKILQDHRG